MGDTYKMLEHTQAGKPGCAACGGTTNTLPGSWGGSLTNLLQTSVMPQPHGSPTFSQMDSESRWTTNIDDGDMSDLVCVEQKVDGGCMQMNSQVRGITVVQMCNKVQQAEQHCGQRNNLVKGESSVQSCNSVIRVDDGTHERAASIQKCNQVNQVYGVMSEVIPCVKNGAVDVEGGQSDLDCIDRKCVYSYDHVRGE